VPFDLGNLIKVGLSRGVDEFVFTGDKLAKTLLCCPCVEVPDTGAEAILD